MNLAATSFTQSICNLGIMGTLYIRDTELLSPYILNVDVSFDEVSAEYHGEILEIDHIYADPTYPISNEIEIHMRKKSTHDHSWITLQHDALGKKTKVFATIDQSFDFS